MNVTQLRKVAGTYEEYLAGAGSNALLRSTGRGLIPLSNIGGTIHGLISTKGTSDPLTELRRLNDTAINSFVPGDRKSRYLRRQRLVTELLKNDKKDSSENHTWHQTFSILNPLNLIAAPVASVAAALTPTRTLDEHSAVVNDPNRNLKQWLIPGYATYNKYKELGLSNRLSDIENTLASLESSGDLQEIAAYKKLLKAESLKRKQRRRLLSKYL